ncbi:6331_t:CDS:2, partial [Rhizophagus irregularis]
IDYHNVLTRNNDNNDESEKIIAEDNNNNDDIYSDNDEQALDLTETGKYNLYGNWDGPVNPNY